jgi:hypothetical protein
MAENKTQPTEASVAAFLDAAEPPQRREDGKAVCAMMARITGETPVMWGPSIVGFGQYRYLCGKREERMCRLGFSPRKSALVLYLTSGYPMRADLLARLGKHTTGVGCLYIKKLADVDPGVLEQMIAASWAEVWERYPD